MKNTGRIRLERETTIAFNEEESLAIVWTSSEMTERKLATLGLVGEKHDGGLRYSIPKVWIKFRKPMILSDKQKASLKEHGKALSLRPRPVAGNDKTT